MLATVEGTAVVAAGGNRWFFIVPDYAFGHSLAEETAAVVQKSGGIVLGTAAYPYPETTDFAAYLLQAKAAGANVIGLGNFGTDLINCVKQADQFGLRKIMQIAAPVAVAVYVHAAGLETMQGLLIPQSYYWDLNDRTRAFARRAMADGPEAAASEYHAGCYAGALHYLKAAAELGVAAAKADGRAVVNRMKAMPFDDDAFGTGNIRADGRAMVTCYLFQVKTPSESTSSWDIFKPLATVSPEQAFRPMSEGGCPFVKA
jgi:branched-chain amino acid transport system substrate-binding protein